MLRAGVNFLRQFFEAASVRKYRSKTYPNTTPTLTATKSFHVSKQRTPPKVDHGSRTFDKHVSSSWWSRGCNHRRRDKDSGCHFRNVFLPNTNTAVNIEPVLLAPKVMGVQQLLDTSDGTGGIAVATAALGNTVSNGLLLIESDA